MRIDQLNAAPNFFLSEGGLETYMVFVEGFDLPCFSAGALLESEAGRAALGAYYERHIAIARDAGRGFVMDTPTWRSGVAWADALGKTDDEILAANGEAVRFVSSFRDRHETDDLPILVNGVIGPAGDGYAPEEMITPARSMEIHLPQIKGGWTPWLHYVGCTIK